VTHNESLIKVSCLVKGGQKVDQKTYTEGHSAGRTTGMEGEQKYSYVIDSLRRSHQGYISDARPELVNMLKDIEIQRKTRWGATGS